MFQMDNGVMSGNSGICYSYSYEGRPIIPILIKGDLTDEWKESEFLLDTGADTTILHSYEAYRLGLDIDKHDYEENITTPIGSGKAYYKRGIRVRIGHFPDLPITIAFSEDVREGLRLLGRRDILNFIGIAFNGKKVGIFTKGEI